jgi:ABC-type uncharacterized transport system substrate-binding protein
MRRREFITLMGGAAAWPLAARAQQPAMPVIGFLSSRSPHIEADTVSAIQQGLREAGFIEHKNIGIDYRWAEGHLDRLPLLAADLVNRQVAVIVAITTPSALAAKAASRTTPIVFSMAGDPVEFGLVASLNKPGGNITGINQLVVGLVAKRLELIHDLVPTAGAVALLENPAGPVARSETEHVRDAASSLGLQFHVVNASSERDVDDAFATVVQQKVGAVVVSTDPYLFVRANQIIDLAARHAVPAIYPRRDFVTAGGLVSYGPILGEGHRQVGLYVGRILRGEKPSDLPAVQPTKFETAINLKTARTLGLDLPASVLARVDEVIE